MSQFRDLADKAKISRARVCQGCGQKDVFFAQALQPLVGVYMIYAPSNLCIECVEKNKEPIPKVPHREKKVRFQGD